MSDVIVSLKDFKDANSSEHKHTVRAVYTVESEWEIDFNLEEVEDWYIKWDELMVIHNKGDAPICYPSDCTSELDFKRPLSIYINQEEI